MVFSKQFPKKLTTNSTSIPDEPNFTVTNPLKKDVFCNGLEVIPSPEFTRKGAMVVKIDGITQYDSRNTDGFLRIAKIPITLNLSMKRDIKVDVFIFNEKDTNLIECTVTVFLSEESKQLDSSMQYISDDVVNSLVSESSILFEKRGYNNEVVTKLIDMAGYSKLILNIASSTIPDADKISQTQVNLIFATTSVSNLNSSTQWGLTSGEPNIFVATDGSRTVNNIMAFIDSEKGECIVDFGSDLSRLLSLTINDLDALHRLLVTTQPIIFFDHGKKTGFFYVRFAQRFKILESDDNITFNLVQDFGSIFLSGNFSAIPITKRYIKIVIEVNGYLVPESTATFNINDDFVAFVFDVTPANQSIVINNVTDVFDGNLKGGTASLSFDELDVSSNIFTEFIPASEFGTISEGENIKRQIGDVSNIAQSGKTYFLPSTQTGFRVKLSVTGGGIETSVSIRKIS